jgi:hypothetical protein
LAKQVQSEDSKQQLVDEYVDQQNQNGQVTDQDMQELSHLRTQLDQVGSKLEFYSK